MNAAVLSAMLRQLRSRARVVLRRLHDADVHARRHARHFCHAAAEAPAVRWRSNRQRRRPVHVVRGGHVLTAQSGARSATAIVVVKNSFVALATSLATLTSCSTPSGPAVLPGSIQVTQGAVQSRSGAGDAPQAIVVRVVDAGGQPVKGADLNFYTATSSGAYFEDYGIGVLSATNVSTDAAGEVRPWVRLSGIPGAHFVGVRFARDRFDEATHRPSHFALIKVTVE